MVRVGGVNRQRGTTGTKGLRWQPVRSLVDQGAVPSGQQGSPGCVGAPAGVDLACDLNVCPHVIWGVWEGRGRKETN